MRVSTRARVGIGIVMASMALVGAEATARAQTPPPLPPPPPPPLSTASPPSPAPDTPVGTGAAPAAAPPPAEVSPSGRPATGEKPPPYDYTPAPVGTHAPHTAFWVGGRAGLLGYGGAFFVNDRRGEETSKNLVGSGASLEVNAGARLNRRYIPYLLVEYAVLAPGRRLPDDAQATSSLLGLGFRFVIGNVDRAGFVADLSLAQRTIALRRGGQTFRMQGPEIFRLGLGAEIRLSTLFTISPMAHLSGGSMEQSDGDVAYAAGQVDGQSKPTFLDGSISRSQRSYLVVGIGCGAHFDLFGK